MYKIETAYGGSVEVALKRLEKKFEPVTMKIHYLGAPSVIRQPEATEEERYLAFQAFGG